MKKGLRNTDLAEINPPKNHLKTQIMWKLIQETRNLNSLVSIKDIEFVTENFLHKENPRAICHSSLVNSIKKKIF